MRAEEFRNWRQALSDEGKAVADRIIAEVLFGQEVHDLTMVFELRDEITRRFNTEWCGTTRIERLGEGPREVKTLRYRVESTPPRADGSHIETMVHTEPGCTSGVIVYENYVDHKVRCLLCGLIGTLGEKVEDWSE